MPVFSVQELTRHIKDMFAQNPLFGNISVKGEISNFRPAASGHYYFTLKDEASSLKVVMFRSRNRKAAVRPENGMAVLVRGYLSVYERDGVYQLYAESLEPDGTGALHLAFEQLKNRLQQEGLFDPAHKKKMPLLPRRIGIVTSLSGAAVRDLVEIIRRRWPGLELVLVPVLVQGEEAPSAVARGIRLLNKLADIEVIIVGRGGGSIEDLWAFNTEVVARSIYDSRIPVISAVGHETDFTIADFVADVRAATPSAAAEIVVPDKKETERYLQALIGRQKRAMEQKARQGRQRLDYCLADRVFVKPLESICAPGRQALDSSQRHLLQNIHNKLGDADHQYATLVAKLNALSPLATLGRGYSICTTPDRKKVVSDSEEVQVGDKLLVRLQRGLLQCLVQDKELQ